MTENNEPTEQEIRREIQQNEQETINKTILIIDALGILIFTLPLVKVYLSRGIASPISDTTSLIALSKAIDAVVSKTLNTLYATIHERTVDSWLLGEKLSIATLNGRIPLNALKTIKLKDAATMAHRTKAMNAFIDRKTKGLNLSGRVWRLEPAIKVQIETVLQLAIYEGKAASEVANDLKKYLRNPDQLFRKVRDTDGKLQLSKAAKLYHPGVGVYRSPYKNAFRLVRNEVNVAYRRANWEAIQDLPFITGQRIQLSNNHPIMDVCDSLSGIYPKNFCWSGWHPMCRCHMLTEIISLDNFAKMEAGTYTPTQTTEFPQALHVWIASNRSRIKDDSGISWVDDNPDVLSMIKKRT